MAQHCKSQTVSSRHPRGRSNEIEMIGHLYQPQAVLKGRSISRSCTTTRAQMIRTVSISNLGAHAGARHSSARHTFLNTHCLQSTETSRVLFHSRCSSFKPLAASGDSAGDSIREDLAESQSEKISDLADVDRTVELLMWIGSSIRWPWQVCSAGGHMQCSKYTACLNHPGCCSCMEEYAKAGEPCVPGCKIKLSTLLQPT